MGGKKGRRTQRKDKVDITNDIMVSGAYVMDHDDQVRSLTYSATLRFEATPRVECAKCHNTFRISKRHDSFPDACGEARRQMNEIPVVPTRLRLCHNC